MNRKLKKMNKKLQLMNIVCTALAAGFVCAPVYATQQDIVLKADTLFDGTKLWSGAGPYAVRIESHGKITQAGLAQPGQHRRSKG